MRKACHLSPLFACLFAPLLASLFAPLLTSLFAPLFASLFAPLLASVSWQSLKESVIAELPIGPVLKKYCPVCTEWTNR